MENTHFVARLTVERINREPNPTNKLDRTVQELAMFVIKADTLESLTQKLTNVVEVGL